MKSILTHQSAHYQGSDVLIINGERSTFSGTPSQEEAFELVKKVTNSVNLKSVPIFCWASGTSKSFKVFLSEQREVVLSSSFKSTDEKGRRISYDFYCDSIDNPSRLVRLLQDYSRIAELELNPFDCKTLESFLSFYLKRPLLYTLTGGATIVLIYVLCKIFS